MIFAVVCNFFVTVFGLCLINMDDLLNAPKKIKHSRQRKQELREKLDFDEDTFFLKTKVDKHTQTFSNNDSEAYSQLFRHSVSVKHSFVSLVKKMALEGIVYLFCQEKKNSNT